MSPIYHKGRKIESDPARSIFDYADALKIRVPTSCGRSGECHECIVAVSEGTEALNSPTSSEYFLSDNYRLACQAYPVDTEKKIEFEVLRRQPKILTQSIKRPIEIEPLVVRKKQGVYRDDIRIDSYHGQIYGIAIDLGTTTVVINLVDLENGQILYTTSFENPQRFGGSDIMNRISYDGGPYQGELQQVIISAINFEIGDMCRKLGFHRRRIYDVVIVGNSTMRDILFGIDVQTIGQRPYKSLTELSCESGKSTSTSLHASAKDLNIRVFPLANVYSGPLIASHLGADVTADLLAIGMDEQEDLVMLIDIGTNTEVVVGNRYGMMAASCPAGPAFEGGEIAYGMPGYEGAVETVRIVQDSVLCETIGKKDAQGICGSGLVDLLSELRRTDKMNELGVLENNSTEFVFSKENNLSLSRADISSLAQAKAANYSGQFIVMRNFGVSPDMISKLYLSGGFANYINPNNAASIGFIANIDENRIHKIGNSSLEGATLMLVSTKMRSIAEDLVKSISHIELETTEDFFEIFVEGCMFKPMSVNNP